MVWIGKLAPPVLWFRLRHWVLINSWGKHRLQYIRALINGTSMSMAGVLSALTWCRTLTGWKKCFALFNIIYNRYIDKIPNTTGPYNQKWKAHTHITETVMILSGGEANMLPSFDSGKLYLKKTAHACMHGSTHAQQLITHTSCYWDQRRHTSADCAEFIASRGINFG
jgi:hypothetical protein